MSQLRKVVKQRKAESELCNNTATKVALSERSEADILEDFISSLNEIDTSVLIMYLDGLSGQEMTEVLGIKLNAVQVRVNRLKKAFTDRYLETP